MFKIRSATGSIGTRFLAAALPEKLKGTLPTIGEIENELSGESELK
jgi:hypothetical protein